MVLNKLSSLYGCVGDSSAIIFSAVFAILVIVIPTNLYFRWTPWLPFFIKRLVTNTTFQIAYLLVVIATSCAIGPKEAIGLYIIQLALFNKFGHLEVPESDNKEDFRIGFWH